MFLKRLTHHLSASKVRYAIVGGYAVSLHGAVRGTLDVDLVIPFEQEVYSRITSVMNELGLSSRLPITGPEVFQFRDEYAAKRNLKAWTFVNPSNPTEMVDILIEHDLNTMKTVRKTTTFGDIVVISLNDLIRMKQGAGRPQDLADIEALRKLH